MPHKTKAQRAAYMRRWRERQKSGSAGRGEVPAPLVEDSDPAAVSPLPPDSDNDVVKEGANERPYKSRKAVQNTVWENHEQSTLGSAHSYAPPFLAAPVDECPMCHHDRQEADHLGGRPCKFKFGRRACGCMFEGF